MLLLSPAESPEGGPVLPQHCPLLAVPQRQHQSLEQRSVHGEEGETPGSRVHRCVQAAGAVPLVH